MMGVGGGWVMGISVLCDCDLSSLSPQRTRSISLSCVDFLFSEIKIILLSQPALSYLALKYLPAGSCCLNYQRFMDFCF